LTETERASLLTIARSRKPAKRDIQSTQIALLANRREATQTIVQSLGISKAMVCKWHGRLAQWGVDWQVLYKKPVHMLLSIEDDRAEHSWKAHGGPDKLGQIASGWWIEMARFKVR